MAAATVPGTFEGLGIDLEKVEVRAKLGSRITSPKKRFMPQGIAAAAGLNLRECGV
jgi:hypothetical protein